eukprot:PITA_07733
MSTNKGRCVVFNSVTSATSVVMFGIAVIAAVLCVPTCEAQGQPIYNFYMTSCPGVEGLVRQVVNKYIAADHTIAASLLRLHFHDCFVRGCDASVLLNSTQNNKAEKDAIPNFTVRGFEVIDNVKAQIEQRCPGVVSCADILALVARDAVFARGGPFWQVKTGRRDGRISVDSEALSNIPRPTFNFQQLKDSFASKGLNVQDLVVLSGAHTIGMSHCSSFSNRLYNFGGSGRMDPTLENLYAQLLTTQCKNLTDNITKVEMDPGSSLAFDSHFFDNLELNRGLLQSDAALLTNFASKANVDNQRNQTEFFENFKLSMQRMGEIGLLTGSAGEIRKHCAFVN